MDAAGQLEATKRAVQGFRSDSTTPCVKRQTPIVAATNPVGPISTCRLSAQETSQTAPQAEAKRPAE